MRKSYQHSKKSGGTCDGAGVASDADTSSDVSSGGKVERVSEELYAGRTLLTDHRTVIVVVI